MSDAGKRLIEGAKEMLAVAKGDQSAARLYINGHFYVPEAAVSGGPVVRPLEWAFRDVDVSDNLSVWIAEAPGLDFSYSVWHSTAPEASAPYSVTRLHNGFFHALEEAQAAAQADYEQRIRSALLPAPTRDDVLEELARHENWELDWGNIDPSDDSSECFWRVHRRSGNPNDREWTLLGIGDTPRAALEAALKGGKS